jgi:fatty acid desaturase
MMNEIYSALALLIGLLCVSLVIHPQYEDGLFGRIALGLIALAELCVFWDAAIDNRDYSGILATTLMIQAGVFLFFLRHVYRFLKWHQTGAHQWRPATKK